MTTQKSAKPRRWLMPVVLFDAVALSVFYYHIPTIRRPLEVLLAILTVLCVITAVAAGPRRLRNALVVGTSVFATLFFLELGQKYINLSELLPRSPKAAAGQTDPWSWKNNPNIAAEYLEVKRRAIAEGILPPEDDFAGDIFAGTDKSELVIATTITSTNIELIAEGIKPYNLNVPPLGSGPTPSNRVRTYARYHPTGTMLFDGAVSINEHSFRETRGNPDSDETYIFLGCSVTFGYGLSDHQTMPYYFSKAMNFEKQVMNFAFSGYGVHQALRDLETDYHASQAGLDSRKVKGVFFGLIDGHILRMDDTRYTKSPYYILRNGRPVYAGSYAEHTGLSVLSRLNILLERSRSYQSFRGRLGWIRDQKFWEITLAMLGEMNRLCMEKYGVPLTVIYWDNHQPALDKLAEQGMPVVKVKEGFADQGDYKAIKYMLFDFHPSAYANEVLGRYVYEQSVRNVLGE